MGVFATVGQFTLTRAYVHAPAAHVGPFLYAGPVFAGLLDWLIWGRLPDALFVAGAVVVVAAATLALRLRSESRRWPSRRPSDWSGLRAEERKRDNGNGQRNNSEDGQRQEGEVPRGTESCAEPR